MPQTKIFCPQQFQSPTESAQFLKLFPHRFDFIQSPQGLDPTWKTISTHPLSDRIIQQSSYLYGVRFGSESAYAMIDIDRGSSYHPAQFPAHLERLKSKLAEIGLEQSIAITSSLSGGLHLYFPIDKTIASWKLAETIHTVLTAAGFEIKDGQLEIFPNARNAHQSLYKAHRLPLQFGSNLLTENYEPEDSDRDRFIHRWHFAQDKNNLTEKDCDRILKSIQRQKFKLSNKASDFLNDLNAEIEVGWNEPGQTNKLLGRIAQRTYIFGHIINGLDKPMEGRPLIEEMVRIAIELPGYKDYCGHQLDIYDRCKDWAKCIESKPKYFPCGFGQPSKDDRTSDEGNRWNLLNAELARDRIRFAIVDLERSETLSPKITDRYHQLKSYGIGGETLYKYLDLWHPNHLVLTVEVEKSIPAETSLVVVIARDIPQNKDLSDREPSKDLQIARDTRLDKSLSHGKAPDRLPAWEDDRASRRRRLLRSRSV